MEYLRLGIFQEARAVAFARCSSSDLIEELTLRGDLHRFTKFITSIKEYLARVQKITPFDPYKFTGDGWILLFPTNTDGPALLTFLKDLCVFFRTQLREQVLDHVGTTPSITGLTFGIEGGPLAAMKIYGQNEYLGRALNIACRLQNAAKDKRSSRAYVALVSNGVFNQYSPVATSNSPTCGRVKLPQADRTIRIVNVISVCAQVSPQLPSIDSSCLRIPARGCDA